MDQLNRITDKMLVQRSEHNDGSLQDLEEIALHQQQLGSIEYINRVCADLKMLYLQDNCIGKIENLTRLRKLEYLNLAMNNVEVVENLENCEPLRKLDLTLNFIGDKFRESLEHLTKMEKLAELTLIGNPCSDFEGYRDYVAAKLQRLESLDGREIEREERIIAIQNLERLEPLIAKQEIEYKRKRARQKEENLREIAETRKIYEDSSLPMSEQRKRFFSSKSAHAPEYKIETARKQKEFNEEDERDRNPFKDEDFLFEHGGGPRSSQPRRLMDDQGNPLNVNEMDIGFDYEDGDDEDLVVSLKFYKHLGTDEIELDVEPTYLRAKVRGKIFQMRFLEEVQCSNATATRSQATGHLVIRMPKVRQIRLRKNYEKKSPEQNKVFKLEPEKKALKGTVDYANICHESDNDDQVPELECLDD